MKKRTQLLSIKNKYNLLKKLMAAFAAVLLILTSAFSVSFAEEADNLPRFGEKIELGRASWSAQVHHGAICYDKDSKPLLCFSTQGGYFFVVDLETGKVKAQYDVIGEYVYSEYLRCGPDNKVYMYFYPEFCFNVYDPIAETYEMLDMKEYNPYVQDGGCMTDDGTIYMGEYNEEGASVYEYNIYTGKEKRYGPLDINCHYVKGVATDGKYIYAGMGVGTDNSKIIRIDKETGEQTEFLKNSGGGIVYTTYYINNKIIGHTNGILHIVNPETLEKENSIRSDHARQGDLVASPYNKAVFYHYCKGGIWEYNIETKENKKVADSDLTVELQWAKLKSGDWVLAMRTDTMEKVGYFNPKTAEVVSMPLDKIADAGPYVQCLEVSDEGLLYCGGYQGSMGIYNTETEEFVASLPKWAQNEGTGFLNGKTYFGTYVDAVMYRYDPERPLKFDAGYNYDNVYRGYEANPSMIYDIEDGQDRPFVVKSYKDKLYVGTMPNYAEKGGALVIIEEEDGVNPPKTEVYRNIINEHSITGITFKDNLVYVSSTARNGLGSENPDTPPQIVVFDTEKKEVIKSVIPELPGLGTTSKTIGEISFGPDGLLWGCSEKDGLVFALNPDTFECVKSVSVNPGFDEGPMARPFYIRWGDDGLIYTSAGWNITVIDPETMEYKVIEEDCNVMTIDNHGNVWYAYNAQGDVYKIPINQFDRLTRFLKTLDKLSESDYTSEEWQILTSKIEDAKKYTEETDDKTIQKAIHNIKALRDKTPVKEPENEIEIILNGNKLELDSETTGNSRLYKDRTILPYRVFLETLGYEAKWNVHTNTITAEKEDSILSMEMNNNIYNINGEKVEFDVPPVLLSGRHYIPVRLISENLGYEVMWNEEENTVIIKKD